jgi:hypothetical protein
MLGGRGNAGGEPGASRRPAAQEAQYDQGGPPDENYGPPPQEPPEDDIPF